ncbi:glycoside hydrolase family 38 N-terminal domain-containing protein [Scandinavium manionii]|uniref:glycoside hydrolase family 38 N-terminal domain-containing protein n=1 Tax=Scandinavium manionii TaxID=2926520 RepID=UPI0021652262|nr:glycoside hydrolase family 38 C-terminal domain-containing protein [Scandinavium manionii]MCS2147068.1 alpha-mannosidase [Scandinavium manionii]
MKTVHLIQHTHWDREWYFTENDSRTVLYYFMADVIARLEADESLGPLVLDGQTVVLEDYFQVAPDNRERVLKLIAAGRLLIGPWYTQTDFLVVGAESITRNLLLGMADCQTLGSRMPVGYVPDSFGQSAQLPMFLAQFAIDRAVIWRGWCEHDVASSEFIWRSADGSSVTTAVLPWGYGCAKWLPTNAEEAWRVLPGILQKQAKFSASAQILLPNGNDQSPFEYGVPAMLDTLNEQQDEYRFVRSDFSRYFQALEGETLTEFQGELLSPKYMRIHRGIFSTRMDIKQANARLENFVSQQLEPLLSVVWRLGLPYPQTAVENIWREAMKSHAHDSIGGCNSDRVNAMVKARLTSGQESASQLFELNMKMLAEGIDARQQGKKIIIFNSLPYERDGRVALTLYVPGTDFCIVDASGQPCRWQIVHEEQQDMSVIVQELSNSTTTVWYRKCTLLLEAKALPACGYQTLYLQEDCAAGFVATSGEISALENAWLRLTLDEGQISLLDKRSGKRWEHILQLVDGGDAGDNYNYSPPEEDWRVTSDGALTSATWQRGTLADTLTLNWSIAAPVDQLARQQHLCNTQLNVSMTLALDHDCPLLDVQVSLDNTLRDHRLQVEIPTDIGEMFHFADQPFGLIRRENRPQTLAVWQQEQWTEAPASLWPMQSLVMMHNQSHGMCVVTEGLREYEIPADKPATLAITLLRSVGWLGQANMPWRPGRASGMVLPSPDSQLTGPFHCHFALLPLHQGPDATFWRDVENWRTPALGWLDSGWSRFKTNPHGKSFPSSYSLLSWDTPLHFSTLKKAQNGDALILRGWNPGTSLLSSAAPVAAGDITPVTLAETPLCAPQKTVSACAPVSWRIQPAKEGKSDA